MEKKLKGRKGENMLIVHRARRWRRLKQAESLAAVAALSSSPLRPLHTDQGQPALGQPQGTG